MKRIGILIYFESVFQCSLLDLPHYNIADSDDLGSKLIGTYKGLIGKHYLHELAYFSPKEKVMPLYQAKVDTSLCSRNFVAKIWLIKVFPEDFYLTLIKNIEIINHKMNARLSRLKGYSFFQPVLSQEGSLMASFNHWKSPLNFLTRLEWCQEDIVAVTATNVLNKALYLA